MDNNNKPNKWKVLVKNVVNHFKNKSVKCNLAPPFRMSSQIKNPSISSHFNTSFQKIDLAENINTYQQIMNDQNRKNRNFSEIKHLNNSNFSDYPNENNDTENPSEGFRLTLHDNSFIRNDLCNKQFSTETNNSTDSLFLHENQEYYKHKQPVMGKAALLKKTNLDRSDSFIVHSIILNKYEDILNHYVNRMYKRRLSRRSNSEDEYSENYTIPRYSPSSVSSVETPGSTSENQKHYFGSEKKCYSVDEFNIETLEDNFDDSSLTCNSYFNNGMSTSCSEYDPKKFLVNALGDLASFESGSQNIDTTQECEESIGTSHISSLISKTNSFCSSLKRNLKRKTSRKYVTEESTKSTVLTSDYLLEQYKKELSRQNSIIFQISKALNYCKTSKDFFIGRERLEAEKILLVATITKEALISEINIIEFDTYRSIFDQRCKGDIKISKITFNLKEKPDPELASDYEEYFLAVLTSGKSVISSEILKERNGVLEVQKMIMFPGVLTDFEVSLFVYSLKMNKKDYNSQGQYKCPSPKSIFKCNTEPRNCKISYKYKAKEEIAFIPIGRCYIRNSEISTIKDGSLSLKLEQDPLRSSLRPSIELKIETRFELTNKMTGFLTIGLDYGKHCLTWSRRWCILDGFLLKYWNYPSEETSDPLGQIDVRHCATEKVFAADRSTCARPKTLALPIRDINGVKKYFLSADTQSDLQLWESELNFVIQSLLIWQGVKDC